MTLQKNLAIILAFTAFGGNSWLNLAHAELQEKQLISRSKLEIENAFQNTVSSPSTPITKTITSPIRIALIYPSADVSDFWVRNYTAMTRRLEELNIPFVADQFSSRQIEHSLQTRYSHEVINSEKPYDFVIFGPSELDIQAENIQALSQSDKFKTFIWAFHTPNKTWKHVPDAWFDFSSSMGAKVLCDYVVKDLGEDIYFALNRGIPGITDTQRSQDFSDCVEEKGGWINMYEHFGQYQPQGGADGARLIAKNFPEVTMLHNANTAMTMGALEVLDKLKLNDKIFITGWGGTAKEIQEIRNGELNATPMRMSDDLGVGTAEAIKYYLEGKPESVPIIYLGRITVVNNKMSAAEIDGLSAEAFRYSGL